MAHQDNHAARGRRLLLQIVRGLVHRIINVGAAAHAHILKYVAHLALIVRQLYALIHPIREGEERHLVFRLQHFQRAQRGVAQRTDEWLNRSGKIHGQRHGQRNLVAAEMRNLLLDTIFKNPEIFFLQVAHHAPGFVFHRRFHQRQFHRHADGCLRGQRPLLCECRCVHAQKQGHQGQPGLRGVRIRHAR